MSAILDFGLGLLGSGFDYLFGSAQQKRQNEFNAEQAQLNRDFQTSEREASQQWNLEQWQRENEYNSPVQQMARMKEAGINPNVAIGQLANSGSGSVRTSPQSGASASSVGMFSSGFGQAFQRYNQTRLINSQIDKTNAETQGLGIDNSNKQRQYDDAHEESVKQRDNLDKLSRKYGLEADLTDISLSMTKQELQFQTDAFKTKLDQLEQDLKNSQEQGKLITEQVETEQAKQDNLAADTANKKADTAYKTAMAEFQNLQNDLFRETGIRPSDGMSAVFAKVLQLKLQGKESEANKLETDYLDLVEKYRDKSQFPDLEKWAVDNLGGLPMFEKGLPFIGTTQNKFFNFVDDYKRRLNRARWFTSRGLRIPEGGNQGASGSW